MKQQYLTRVLPRICLILLCIYGLFIINSCKKDIGNQQQLQSTDPVVEKAEAWYKSTYPVTAVVSTNNKLTLQSTAGDHHDFSQFINPDWQHPRKYARLNHDVIEIPVDPGSKIASSLKNIVNNKAYANKKNSKTSFLILNDGKGYQAYLMTIIADSAYLKNDYTKLARNTYSKRDTDFSGIVLYFTPKGDYVSGYAYKNGHLLVPDAQAAGSQKVQSVKVNTQTVCEDWYLDTFIDDELVSSVYLYSNCSTDGSAGGGGGSTPPVCTAPPSGTVGNAYRPVGVNVAAPIDNPIDPGDGGFPPPAPTQQQCPVVRPTDNDITAADPCAAARILASNTTLAGKMAALTALTSGSIEQGYKIDADGTVVNVIGGVSGINSTQWNLGATEQLSAILHNHDNDPMGNVSIFSDSDIGTLYTLIYTGHATASIYAGLTTNSNTKYLLQISDITKFRAFFSNPTTANLFSYSYSLVVNHNNTAGQNELACLKYIGDNDMGLTLSRANSNFTNYTRLGLNSDKSSVINNPCSN